MKHQIKKIKIKTGRDANQMLIKKLAKNFIKSGSLITTKTRAKFLISFLERLLDKAKKNPEKSQEYLFRRLGDKKIIRVIIQQIVPLIKEKTSGYLKLHLLKRRIGDGALMAKVEWSFPVVLKVSQSKKEKKKKEIVKK